MIAYTLYIHVGAHKTHHSAIAALRSVQLPPILNGVIPSETLQWFGCKCKQVRGPRRLSQRQMHQSMNQQNPPVPAVQYIIWGVSTKSVRLQNSGVRDILPMT